MQTRKNSDYKISDRDYILSSIGNAYHSGMSFDQTWECIAFTKTREELDQAVSTQIQLNKLLED